MYLLSQANALPNKSPKRWSPNYANSQVIYDCIPHCSTYWDCPRALNRQVCCYKGKIRSINLNLVRDRVHWHTHISSTARYQINSLIFFLADGVCKGVQPLIIGCLKIIVKITMLLPANYLNGNLLQFCSLCQNCVILRINCGRALAQSCRV